MYPEIKCPYCRIQFGHYKIGDKVEPFGNYLKFPKEYLVSTKETLTFMYNKNKSYGI